MQPQLQPTPFSVTLRRLILLAFLLVVPATHTLLNPLDNDLWSHMRTGQWILENSRFPDQDPFVSNPHGPYIAYSWTFEILLYKLHQWFGLTGTVAYALAVGAAIQLIVFNLLQRLCNHFTLAAILSSGFALASWTVYRPRSWLLTVLMFVILLGLLMRYRTSGRTVFLRWIPLVFILWANVHIQFLLGLMLLGIFFIEGCMQRWLARKPESTEAPFIMSPKTSLALLVSCIVATLANPYGWRIYGVIIEYLHEQKLIGMIDEFRAPTFGYVNEWCATILVVAGLIFFIRYRAIGWFAFGFLLVGAFFGLRASRYMWLAGLSGAVVMSMALRKSMAYRFELTPLRVLGVIPLWLGALLLLGQRESLTNRVLEERTQKEFPKRACDFVIQQKLRGPVYGPYGWGGYLIWRLREPVVIDGRTYVHGEEKILRALDVLDAKGNWQADADFKSAQTFVVSWDDALALRLAGHPKFKVVYQDDISLVCVPIQQ